MSGWEVGGACVRRGSRDGMLCVAGSETKDGPAEQGKGLQDWKLGMGGVCVCVCVCVCVSVCVCVIKC